MFKASSARLRRAALVVGMLAAAPLAAQAQVYKCSQANGSVTYQGTPCAAGQKQVERPIDTSGGAAAPAPSASSLVADVQARNRRDIQQQAYDDAHKHDATPARQAACAAARRELGILDQQVAVFTVDDKGNRHYVDDKDRANTIAQAQRRIAENCN